MVSQEEIVQEWLDAGRALLTNEHTPARLERKFDMPIEQIRRAATVVQHASDLIPQLMSGAIGIYDAWQLARAAEKKHRRETPRAPRARTPRKPRPRLPRPPKQARVRQPRPLRIGERRLIWLYAQASRYARIGRCHTCGLDVAQPDARCIGIERRGDDDRREIWLHRVCGSELDRCWTPF